MHMWAQMMGGSKDTKLTGFLEGDEIESSLICCPWLVLIPSHIMFPCFPFVLFFLHLPLSLSHNLTSHYSLFHQILDSHHVSKWTLLS